MKRESFIFYRSFYESIKELDPEDQATIYNAIFEYQFNANMVELKGVCKSIFTLIIPQLEANNKKYLNGKRGGRPKNETQEVPKQNQTETKMKPNNNLNETKTKPKQNQTITKPKPNDNDNDNDNDNVNDNDNDNDNIYEYIEKNYDRSLSQVEKDTLDEWLLLFDKDIIKYACKISIKQDIKKFSYMEGILKNLKDDGYVTLEEIQKSGSKVPNWYNKNISKGEMSEENKKVMNDILKEYQ